MRNRIKEFCEKYKEKLENDKKIKSDPIFPYYEDFTDRIEFHVSYSSHAPGSGYMPSLTNHSINTIALDAEDLKYLYNKYSNKLSEELNDKIQDLIKDYSSILTITPCQ